MYITKKGGEFIYFNNNKEWVFFKDNKSDLFWCNYHRYWSFFETKFNLKYHEIQALTKIMVEESLNNDVATPKVYASNRHLRVEESLNNDVATPALWVLVDNVEVEESLNNGLATPKSKQ